jgi:glycosyltransferase involved in cell wall biosynthesis
MADPRADVAAAGHWLLGLEEEHRPDVIHLNGYAHGALPLRAPVLVVGHSCVLSWWRAVKGEVAPAEWENYRRAVRQGLARADLVVAPSHEMLRALREHYGPLPASRVIYNARAAASFPPGRKRPLILSAGRLWDEAKNLAALECVAGDLAWRVCVAGDDQGPDGSAVTARQPHPLARLTPKAVARWLGWASIYCLPARYEPFGLSALEAALAGCALVLGDIPSLREVWGDAAVFVPPNEAPALRQALQQLIHDPVRRTQLATVARARAARYGPQRTADAYLSAYRHLAGRHPTHATSRPVEPSDLREFVHGN